MMTCLLLCGLAGAVVLSLWLVYEQTRRWLGRRC